MEPTIANTDMAAAWDGAEGHGWARDWRRYDLVVAAHHRTLLDAAAVGTSDVVLDVGCGNGQVTRDAARSATQGSALGVDLSTAMLAVAQREADREGLLNARFEQADAQVHPFPDAAHDLLVSRYGAMFFDDPVAAFANLRRTLSPGGRVALLAWRSFEENEWLAAIPAALALGRPVPRPPAGTPGPFGLADPDRTRSILADAGFGDVDLEPVDLPVFVGADADDAFDFVKDVGITRGMTQDLDDADKARALDALHQAMADRESPDGVVIGSGSWLIRARRPPG